MDYHILWIATVLFCLQMRESLCQSKAYILLFGNKYQLFLNCNFLIRSMPNNAKNYLELTRKQEEKRLNTFLH